MIKGRVVSGTRSGRGPGRVGDQVGSGTRSGSCNSPGRSKTWKIWGIIFKACGDPFCYCVPTPVYFQFSTF